MSVFFEYPTDVSAAGKGQILSFSFSGVAHPILAVSTTNGELTLFHEEGESIAVEVHTVNGQEIDTAANSQLPASFSRSSAQCVPLCWHPSLSLLACGWSDGCVSLWSEKDRSLKEDLSGHKGSPISLLVWSPEGSRLVTGDESGVVCVWKIDNRHRQHLLCRYQRQGKITQAVFREMPANTQTNTAFFFGGTVGTVWYADDGNHCSEAMNVSQPLLFIHFSSVKDCLVLVTSDITLYKYHLTGSGSMEQQRKVKLSLKGDGSDVRFLVAGHGLLCAANHESMVRFWHIDSEDSYVLSFDGKHQANSKDVITCVSFNPRKRVLCAGTASGRIVFWRYVRTGEAVEPSEHDWEALPAMESSASIQSIQWGPGEGIIALRNETNVSIVLETVMQYKHTSDLNAVQLTADSVMVQRGEEGKPVKFNTSIRVKGLDLSEQHCIVWNGKKAEVREIGAATDDESVNVQLVSSFSSRASLCALHNDTVYSCVSGRIEMSNLHGTVTNVLTFSDSEGIPVCMSICGNFLCVATSLSRLKLWEVGKKEPKLIVPNYSVLPDEFGIIIQSIRVNSNGSKVSLLIRRVDASNMIEVNDTRLHVYDVEIDRLFSYEFGPSNYPVIHVWDQQESRLLVVQTKQVEGHKEEKTESGIEDKPLNTADVTTLFVTSDHGVLMQDSFPIDPHNETLMSLHVPYFLFLSRPSADDASGEYQPRLQKKTMRDFIGLEHVSEETKRDLLAFSFFLTIGNMDEAYRAVKKIDQEGIWNNMAALCVKTKRLDVAEVCLGNMNNARGVRAVRLVKQKDSELEVAIAQVAIQLHLLDDAERLYKECGRYDLLVEFYCACGRWKEAIALASKSDRIHLKSTHFHYAKHLEQIGEYQQAIQHYELSGTHLTEVPRLLTDQNMGKELETYIQQHPHPQLLKWWAQFCESNGAYDTAIQFYQRAGEILALVRVYCYRGDERAAMEVCAQTADPAACYHLARQLESTGQIEAAIQYYCNAHRFNHAIRLGKEHQLDGQLLNAALQSTDNQCKVEAAQYFEAKSYWEKAAMLYEKGGNINRALDICFSAQLFDTLRSIAEQLQDNTDPVILNKCATFFLQHKQYEKAVGLLITAKDYSAAIQLCTEHSIRITDNMAEKLTPPKGETQRESLLLQLATLCRDQGSFHLACKKFTQAGDSLSGIRCLIKSGDVEKITYYASMTKKNEVYLLVANFFQTLDWRSDESILRSIVSFYQRAKANQPLSAFYEHCACVEIDEYRDYEKALAALRESVKYMLKAKLVDKEKRVSELDARIRLVEMFVEARSLIHSNPIEMLRLCEQLKNTTEVNGSVRIGDVYALLMEYYHSQEKYREAYQTIQQMKERKIPIVPYLDADIVKQIYQHTGEKMKTETELDAESERHTESNREGQRERETHKGRPKHKQQHQESQVVDEEIIE